MGLSRDALGRAVKRPDREVQDRIELVFATFLRGQIPRQGRAVIQRPKAASAATENV